MSENSKTRGGAGMSRAPQLVRARPKAAEYLPDYSKCCDKALAHNLALGEMTIDLSKQRRESRTTCVYCGNKCSQENIIVPDVADGYYVELGMLDLDEGPVIHE